MTVETAPASPGPQAIPMARPLEGLRAGQGWTVPVQYNLERRTAFLHTPIGLGPVTGDLMVLADEPERWLMVIVRYPVLVPRRRRSKACALFNRITEQDPTWRLTVDMETGEIAAAVTADYRGCADPGDRLASLWVSSLVSLFEEWAGELQSLTAPSATRRRT